MLTAEQKRQFVEDGYVIVDEAVEARLREPLREAAGRVVARARAGQWPHKRGVPGDSEDIWGVHHLLHPDLGETVFAEYMATDAVVEVCGDLLGADLRLGLVNLLVNPRHGDFAIGWHRDMLREEMAPEREAAELAKIGGIVQWNTALYDDACLLIVPGSHRRAATPEEREVLYRRPMDAMPGEKVVELRAGQGVYYNFLLLHRGVYPHGQMRASIHAALTSTGGLLFPYHYESVRWMEKPGFRETLPPRLHPLYDNWLAMGAQVEQAAAAGKA